MIYQTKTWNTPKPVTLTCDCEEKGRSGCYGHPVPKGAQNDARNPRQLISIYRDGAGNWGAVEYCSRTGEQNTIFLCTRDGALV